jgi:DNA-binding NtrC family response regulator
MDHFLEQYYRRRGDDVPSVSEDVKRAFMHYAWPGNVRELENVCERIAQTCRCGTIRVGCVASSVLLPEGVEPPEIGSSLTVPHDLAPIGLDVLQESISLDDRLRQFETSLIREALIASDGNKSHAAELLQIKRSTLGDRINRCGLNGPNARGESLMSTPAAARHERGVTLPDPDERVTLAVAL